MPIDLSASSPPLASSSSSTAPPKRRRVPITIVKDDDHPPIITQPTSDNSDLLLNPISSRRVSQTPSTPSASAPSPDGKLTTPKPPASDVSKPTPTSFREAKQVREAKSAGRVGGGIFRMSGKDTVFETRDVLTPAVADPPPHKGPSQIAPAPPPPATATREPLAAPRTLFEFMRAWDSIPSSDTSARWTLLNVRFIHLSSLSP